MITITQQKRILHLPVLEADQPTAIQTLCGHGLDLFEDCRDCDYEAVKAECAEILRRWLGRTPVLVLALVLGLSGVVESYAQVGVLVCRGGVCIFLPPEPAQITGQAQVPAPVPQIQPTLTPAPLQIPASPVMAPRRESGNKALIGVVVGAGITLAAVAIWKKIREKK